MGVDFYDSYLFTVKQIEPYDCDKEKEALQV